MKTDNDTPRFPRSERQNDEIEALKSIFSEEFRSESESQKIVWGQNVSPAFSILVRAAELSSDAGRSRSFVSSVRLRVTLPILYPDAAPALKLVEPHNLSQGQLNSMLTDLQAAASRMLGSEMIYDLIMLVQARVRAVTHNEPRSLIEERAQRLKASDERLSHEQALQQINEDHEHSLQTIRMRRKIEESLREQAARTLPLRKHPTLRHIKHSPPREVVFGRPFELCGFQVQSLFLSTPLAVNDLTCTRPWLSFVPNAGTILVKEYSFAVAAQDLVLELENALSIVQETFHTELGVENYAYTVIAEENCLKLFLAQEYARRGSLQTLLETTGRVSIELAKRWLIDLAQELVQAHRLGIHHGHICAAKIVFKASEGRVVASLCDWQISYLVHRQNSNVSTRGLEEASGTAPDCPQIEPNDVLDLCHVFLRMILGAKLDKNSFEQNLLNYGSELRSDMRRFFDEIMRSARPQRITASDLLSMDFLRTPESIELHSPSHLKTDITPASRYTFDFEELSTIGRGAFGVVVKARNRLDGRIYAIKKIKSGADARVLREVSGLARLNHPSIIRYFSSWIESQAESSGDYDVQEDASDDSSISDQAFYADDFMSTGNIVFTDANGSKQASIHSSPSLGSGRPSAPVSRLLYIQMEYCSGNTLRTLIDEKRLGQIYWSYFSQIVDGVRYIHNQGLIHRDLKPANIFVSADGQLKLGDFGLATEIVVPRSSSSGRDQILPSEDTGDIGTFLYQAPELLQESPRYDAKVDIYALGIILGEMVCPWHTGMERVIILRNLRSPSIVHSLDTDRFEQEISLLKDLLNHEPSMRPSAEQLVELLPPVVHRPRLQETLRLLKQDRVFRSDVLSHFFADDPTITEYVYDAEVLASQDVRRKDAAASSLLMARTNDDIRRVFRTHGALDRTSTSSGLFPYSHSYRTKDHIVRVVDERSNVLQLPFDFKVPFARQVARGGMTSETARSFVIGPVYRSFDGKIESLLEADFDLIQDATYAGEDFGIEALRVLYELASDLENPTENLRIVIGHHGLTKLMLHQARVPSQDESKITNILVALAHNVKKSASAHWNKALGASLPQSAILQLMKFIPSLELTLEEEVERILGLLDPDLRSRAAHICQTLLDFYKAAKTYGIDLPVVFHPFVHGTSIFSLTYSLETNAKRSEVLAIGGEYSDLIADLALPGSTEKTPRAFGFSLSVDKFMRFISTERTRKSDRQVDIIINAQRHEPRAIELITRLWTKKISSELCFDDDVLSLCQKRNAALLLSFKERRGAPISQQVVRVKRLADNESEDVAFDAVVAHVLAEVNEVQKAAGQPTIPKLERTSTYRKEPEVIIIASDESRKQKIAQRDMIAGKAIECARLLTEQLDEASVPILAVDFDAEHMQMLRKLHPRSTDETQARLISDQMASPIARAHFLNLRAAISKLQDTNKLFCIVYSYKCSEFVLMAL